MKLGGLDISTVKLGASQVQAIYQGPNLVWQNAPVATAATGVGQTSFTANWNAYSGATYYLLDVSESSDFSTFIYQNQIVEAPTTSYVVIGLNPNTTYYYRVRANVGFDADAQAFFDRVTTAGGTLSTTEQDAVNTLVVQMKAVGIWTKMKAIYPMVGGGNGTTAQRTAACAQNLKSSSFTGSFTATGWTFASTGVKGNGTSAYFDTNVNVFNELSNTSAHYSAYMRSAIDNNTGGFGVVKSDFTERMDYLLFSGDYYSAIGAGGGTLQASSSIGHPFIVGSRVSSTSNKLYIDGVLQDTKTGSNTANLPNSNFYLGWTNNSAPSIQYINEEFAFASLGDGLSDTEASDFYTAVQAFQTTLARQV